MVSKGCPHSKDVIPAIVPAMKSTCGGSRGGGGGGDGEGVGSVRGCPSATGLSTNMPSCRLPPLLESPAAASPSFQLDDIRRRSRRARAARPARGPRDSFVRYARGDVLQQNEANNMLHKARIESEAARAQNGVAHALTRLSNLSLMRSTIRQYASLAGDSGNSSKKLTP